jgi:glyoxylase-like metal-dependent hydrolase (beta-lactamase superfamily II)
MTASALARGVTRVATSRRDNAFLIDGDDGLTLVDVGWASAPAVLLGAVTEIGRKPADIKRVILTHAHPDHVQGAAGLRRQTGATIVIHQADAGWLPGGRVPPGGRSGALGRLIDRVPKLHWTPFEADATVGDGDLIEGAGGLRVIHTPGHSPGHIALLHEPTGTVLAGDAVFHRGGLSLGPGALAADPAARAASLARIPAEVTAVGFAHGQPLSGPGIESYRAFLDQLS